MSEKNDNHTQDDEHEPGTLSPDMIRRIQSAGDGLRPEEEERILAAMRAAYHTPLSESSEAELEAEIKSQDLERFLLPRPANLPFYRRPALIAAGLLLLLGASLAFFYLRSPGTGGDPDLSIPPIVYKGPPVRGLGGKGKTLLIRDSKRTRAGRGTAIIVGDILSIRRKGFVEFGWGLEGVFRLEGPALLEIRALQGLKSVELELHYGSLYLLGKKHGSLTLHTEFNSYRMIGTMARLYRKDSREELEVLEGAFELRSKNQTKAQIGAGQAVYMEESSAPGGAGVMSETALARLRRYRDALSGLITRERNRIRMETEPATNLTLPEIKKRYGSVYTIRLKSGKILKGYYLSHGDSISIISTEGRLKLKSAEVDKIKELAPPAGEP